MLRVGKQKFVFIKNNIVREINSTGLERVNICSPYACYCA
jgi:hypothetical protein